MRVLKWIVQRCQLGAHAIETSIGWVPEYEDLDLRGLENEMTAEKFSEAVSPLEAYVKVQPGDPAGHYQLATAYARTGRKPEADRQIALQRETAATSPRSDQR